MLINRMILILILGYISPVFAAPQIYHGKTVTSDQQFPFVVAIYDKDGDSAYCTGSVIAEKWVLTASHCVTQYHPEDPPYIFKPEDVFVGTGHRAHSKLTANKVISVKNVYVYNNTVDPHLVRDVALLELNEPARVAPVALPDSFEQFSNLKSGSQVATAIGYGYTSIKWSADCELYPTDTERCHMEEIVYDDALHYGSEAIQSHATIIATIKEFKKLFPPTPDEGNVEYNAETMLGSNSPEGTITTVGDSGGPLVLSINTENGKSSYMQVGVVSWGAPNPYNYTAYKLLNIGVDVYANVTEPLILDFIKKTIKNNP